MEIAIVKETKIWERRVSLIPDHVKTLIDAGHRVFVETCSGLASGFPDSDYEKNGARIVDTDEAYSKQFLVRVKEPPIDTLREGQIIAGFLHIEKGQNPTLLNALLEKNITAYAVEEITDPKTTHRLVSMGFEAGIVGMFEGLRTYGKLLEQNNQTNPFKDVKPIHEYPSKKEAYLALREINPRDFIATVCIAGYGKVSKGAQEVLAQLSHPPLVLREEETLRTNIHSREFAYIWKHLPKIDILVNAIVWKPGQQRVLTEQDLCRMKNNSLIIDISCDSKGGIETCHPTTWEDPTYQVTSNNKSITHFCVDNLPSALAHDSSTRFSEMALPFVLKIANGEELTSGLMTKEGNRLFT